MTSRRHVLIAGLIALVAGVPACSRRTETRVAPPAIVRHTEWQSQAPLGYSADGTRRNLKPGDSLTFHALVISVLGTRVEPSLGQTDVVQLRLAEGGTREELSAAEGAAFKWRGFHVAIVG